MVKIKDISHDENLPLVAFLICNSYLHYLTSPTTVFLSFLTTQIPSSLSHPNLYCLSSLFPLISKSVLTSSLSNEK